MAVSSFLSFGLLSLHIAAKHAVAEECKNRKPVDIGFMLDESGSVKAKDWKNVGKFTKVISKAASIQKDMGQASIITFATSSKLSIRFDAYQEYDAFARAVDNLRKHGGGTNIIDALNRGLNEMFQTKNGMREKSEKIAVLITDGNDSNSISIYKEVGKKYQERKIKLLIIGVGNVGVDKLKELVRDEKDFFVAENFDQLLNTVVSRIAENVQGVCEAINCQWNNWSLGECSKTCGTGKRTNTRSKLVEEEHGGTCLGQPTKIEACNTQQCPAKVHCEWSEWKIGKCDKSCGGGYRSNTRSMKVKAKNGGKGCTGSPFLTEKCNLHKCAEKGPVININDISIDLGATYDKE